MKSIELQKEFNKKYARALRYNAVNKSADKLIGILNKLNELRDQEGTEPLSLPNLENRIK